MINIISNAWYALLALVVLTTALHFLLVYPNNLSKKQWKKVDYIWISLTGIGLIGATSNVELFLSKSRAEMASDQIPFQYKYLSSFLQPEGSPTVCRHFMREANSPNNFDSVVQDFDRACEWSKIVYQIVSEIDTNDYRQIDKTRIPHLDTESNKWYKEVIIHNINKYNEIIKEKEGNQSRINSNSGINLMFLAPIFLILGISIRITKVSGEIRLENQ